MLCAQNTRPRTSKAELTHQLLLGGRQLLVLDGLPQREVWQEGKDAKAKGGANEGPGGHLVL